MSRLIPGRAGALSEIVSEAKAAYRRGLMLAEMAALAQLGPELRSTGVPSDKSYTTEQRLNALINKLGGLANSSNGGFLQYTDNSGDTIKCGHMISSIGADAAQCSSSSQLSTGISIPVEAGPLYIIEAWVWFVGQSTNSAYITLAGPTAFFFNCIIEYSQMNLGNVAVTGAEGAEIVSLDNQPSNLLTQQGVIGNNTGNNTNPLVNGQDYIARIRALYAVNSGTGNLTVNNASSANVASFTVKAGSMMIVHIQ